MLGTPSRTIMTKNTGVTVGADPQRVLEHVHAVESQAQSVVFETHRRAEQTVIETQRQAEHEAFETRATAQQLVHEVQAHAVQTQRDAELQSDVEAVAFFSFSSV